MRILALIVVLVLQACGGNTSEDYYEQDGYCYAKYYYDGTNLIRTQQFTAYPGKCE